MRFQHAISSGEEVAVRFSVLDPRDEAVDGFYMTNLNNPIVTLPIEFFPYGGSNYYGEAEPFHTFYRANGAYPSLGIYSATVTYGTQVYGKLNYLDFTIYFSRNDINGLVLEIPVVNQDGTIIYSDPTLVNLPSGSQYPCSVGLNTNVFCYYEKGSVNDYGRPTRIYITQFSASTSLNLRMLFTNPDNVGVFPSFTFKAFGGSYSAPKLMGQELRGRYTIVDAFKIFPETDYYSTGSCTTYPNRGLYQKQTVYDFYITHAQNANSYVIAEWNLNTNTYGEIGEFELVSSYMVDYFTISYAENDRRLYMVKKLGSYYAGGGSDYHRFGYLRQKHFLYNSFTVYLLKQPSFSVITCTVSLSWVQTHRMINEYNTPSLSKMDVDNRVRNTNSWHYISVYLGNMGNLRLDEADSSDMIVAVKFVSNLLYSSFHGSTWCNIETGVSSVDRLRPVTCELDSTNNQIILRNVGKFSSDYLKLYYRANTINGESSATTVEVRVYANSQSYATSGGWALFRGTTGSYNLADVYFTSGSWSSTSSPNHPAYYDRLITSGWTDTSGYAQILSVSSTQIKVRVRRGSAASFNNVYQMTFRFYTERLNFSGCQGVSFTSNRYSANFKSLSGCYGTDRYFHTYYNFYSTGGNSWPYWYANDYFDFTFTFSSITGDVSNNPNFLFITSSINWYQSIYHHNDHGKCGCCGNCCSSYCCGWDDGSCDRYCCSYYCCSYCSCRWYYSYGTFLLTGRYDINPYEPSISTLAQSHSVELVSRQYNV